MIENGYKPELKEALRVLRLPVFALEHSAVSAMAANESWTFDRFLLELCQLELVQREQHRRQKLLASSRLPREKTLGHFERKRLKRSADQQFAALIEGDFLERSENVLVFGPPGSGKTHLLCALGHELIDQGKSVLFSQCVLLVQRLLLAKNELWLERELKRLDKFEALIKDDLGYVQQSREEMEVLFTLLPLIYSKEDKEEPGRNGSIVYFAGASLREKKRAADEQPGVFRMGANLQRPAARQPPRLTGWFITA